VKITKRQLRRIIREEANRLNESMGVISGLGFGYHKTGMVPYSSTSPEKNSPAALAFNKNRATHSSLVHEYASGDEEILLRRAVTSYVDGYMLRMSMNSGDARDRQRVRMQVDDLVSRQLDAFLGEE